MVSLLDPEEWVEIRDFPDYLVSNWGRIYSVRTDTELKPRPSGWGYLQVCLSNSGIRKMKYVHRLVAEHFLPGEDEGLEVNHIDGDKIYNHEMNLEWVTKSMNNQHSHDLGLNKGRGIPIKVVETGQEYSSIVDCAQAVGMTPPGVKYALRYGTKTRQGFTFEYASRT